MDACNSNANYIGTDYAPSTAHPSTVGTYLNAEKCGSRLPCGLCLITNQPCPMCPIRFGGPTCSTTISNAQNKQPL